MPKSKRQQRLRLFDHFAGQLSDWSQGKYTDLFACPICLRLFGRQRATEGQLTLAHFPPRAVKGTTTTLLCRDCNSRLGHTVENDLKEFERFQQVATQSPARDLPTPSRAKLQFADTTLRVEVTRTPGLHIKAKPTENPPWTPELGERFETSREFKLSFSFRFDLERVRRALLAAAYLACFCHLGYPFVLTQGLKTVRKQLMEPDRTILSNYCTLDAWKGRGGLQILYIKEPEDLESVLVTIGTNLVVLPPPYDSEGSVYAAFGKQNGKQVFFKVALFYADQSNPDTVFHTGEPE